MASDPAAATTTVIVPDGAEVTASAEVEKTLEEEVKPVEQHVVPPSKENGGIDEEVNPKAEEIVNDVPPVETVKTIENKENKPSTVLEAEKVNDIPDSDFPAEDTVNGIQGVEMEPNVAHLSESAVVKSEPVEEPAVSSAPESAVEVAEEPITEKPEPVVEVSEVSNEPEVISEETESNIEEKSEPILGVTELDIIARSVPIVDTEIVAEPVETEKPVPANEDNSALEEPKSVPEELAPELIAEEKADSLVVEPKDISEDTRPEPTITKKSESVLEEPTSISEETAPVPVIKENSTLALEDPQSVLEETAPVPILEENAESAVVEPQKATEVYSDTVENFEPVLREIEAVNEPEGVSEETVENFEPVLREIKAVNEAEGVSEETVEKFEPVLREIEAVVELTEKAPEQPGVVVEAVKEIVEPTESVDLPKDEETLAEKDVVHEKEKVVYEPSKEEVVHEPSKKEVDPEPSKEKVVFEPLNEEVVPRPLMEEVVSEPLNEVVVLEPLIEEVVSEPSKQEVLVVEEIINAKDTKEGETRAPLVDCAKLEKNVEVVEPTVTEITKISVVPETISTIEATEKPVEMQTSRDVEVVAEEKKNETPKVDAEVINTATPIAEPVLESKEIGLDDKPKGTVETGVEKSLADIDDTKTEEELAKEQTPNKKPSNGIISKVKHSLVKVKKAIMGKSPSSKTITTDAKPET